MAMVRDRRFLRGGTSNWWTPPRRIATRSSLASSSAASRAASHAFVQTLDGVTGRTTYHRYPFDAFRADPHEFDIQIGPNRFRLIGSCWTSIAPEGRMRGELRFAGLTPWPVTRSSPGVMGRYTYAPFMECYHGVLSFDHGIAGSLAVDGRELDFSGGHGYIEKDWGQAFPKAWIWTQSNHFGADARGHRSPRRLRSSRGCGAHFPASSWGCGMTVSSTALRPTPARASSGWSWRTRT